MPLLAGRPLPILQRKPGALVGSDSVTQHMGSGVQNPSLAPSGPQVLAHGQLRTHASLISHKPSLEAGGEGLQESSGEQGKDRQVSLLPGAMT